MTQVFEDGGKSKKEKIADGAELVFNILHYINVRRAGRKLVRAVTEEPGEVSEVLVRSIADYELEDRQSEVLRRASKFAVKMGQISDRFAETYAVKYCGGKISPIEMLDIDWSVSSSFITRVASSLEIPKTPGKADVETAMGDVLKNMEDTKWDFNAGGIAVLTTLNSIKPSSEQA
jgi:hypothetical protein